MRTALVNEATLIVENIIVASPVDPCPFAGLFMVGLQEAVSEEQNIRNEENYPSGSIVTIKDDGSITVTLVDGTQINRPVGTTVIKNLDGSINIVYFEKQIVEIASATACDMGWKYDRATGTFAP